MKSVFWKNAQKNAKKTLEKRPKNADVFWNSYLYMGSGFLAFLSFSVFERFSGKNVTKNGEKTAKSLWCTYPPRFVAVFFWWNRVFLWKTLKKTLRIFVNVFTTFLERFSFLDFS